MPPETRKKRIIMVSTAVVITAALAVTGFVAWPAKGKESGYRTARITKGDIVSTVSATGTVNPVETVQVGTQVSGKIISIHADFNSRVRKEEILARLDPAIYTARLDQAKGGVIIAAAGLERATSALKEAKRDLSRKRLLFDGGHIPRSDLDAAETALEIAEAEVSAAKGELSRARGAVADAVTNLSHTVIRSPVDGIVTARSIEVGQTVAASFQTPTLFSIARDLARIRVECIVDEADIGKVAVGQEVEFTIAAEPGVTFRTRVSEIRQAPVKSENVVSYQVLAEADNGEFILRPGMTANVTITTAIKRNVIRVPNASLRFMSPRSGKKKGDRVWIPGGDRLKRVDVKTGISDGSYTEMVSGGLREGLEVVVQSTPKDGRKSRSAGGALHGVRY
jgi:HlyD family secretion protein